MSARTSLRTLLVLAAIGGAIFALHCSSSDSGSSSNPSCGDADPTTVRHLTPDQTTVVTHASDRTKAALSAAEWRYLFKLRYGRFPRAVAETDPVVVKALATIAQDTTPCTTPAAHPSSVDPCDRFVNAGNCWNNSPVASSTVPCFIWSMMVAGSHGCSASTSPAATHIDAQAWDDSQDGHENEGCVAPCIAGGGCFGGVCKCAPDEAPCTNGCGRKKSDVLNCGDCSITCGAGILCIEGGCGGAPDGGADASSDDAASPDASDAASDAD